jgi:hypothetical protein
MSFRWLSDDVVSSANEEDREDARDGRDVFRTERQKNCGAPRRVVWRNWQTFELLTASIDREIAASTSETSVNLYQYIRRNIPEDSHHHTRHRENLKRHNPQRCLRDNR